jgi:hypothetical protein
VAGYIYWMICQHLGLQITDKYCEHAPERVINVNGTAIMWGVPVITDGTILENRLEVVLHDEENTCLLNDIPIPSDSNINTKDTEKLS